MPSLAQYRHSLAVESGPYVGMDVYDVHAMSGSDTTKLSNHQYPIMSGIAQQDLYLDRPLFRPDATYATDRDRVVMTYDPPTGTLTPDLPWTMAPIPPASGTTYEYLEAHTYGGLEAFTYEMLEGITQTGPGERFEILGPFDSGTLHQFINDGLKQCWQVVEVAATATPGASRHDLSQVTPWLQDQTHVRQVGVLGEGQDRNLSDPYENIVYGSIDRDGGAMYFNSGSRTFNVGDTLFFRCYKRAYDHCRAAGGEYGDQSGLLNETDEAPIDREWATSAALVIAWRRFAHLLEPLANQRIIRDQATAAAWFNARTHQHFTAVQPQLLFRRARRFGPSAA